LLFEDSYIQKQKKSKISEGGNIMFSKKMAILLVLTGVIGLMSVVCVAEEVEPNLVDRLGGNVPRPTSQEPLVTKDVPLVIASSTDEDSVAQENVAVSINKKALTFEDTKPYIAKNGQIVVPLRSLAEKMGAKVTWYSSSSSILLKYHGKEVRLNPNIKIKRGKSKSSQLKVFIKNGKTYIPLRKFMELFNLDIRWNAKKRTAEIKMPEKVIRKDDEQETSEIQGSSEIQIDKNFDGQSIAVLTGQKIILTLPSNPSTGYSWQYATTPDVNVLKEVGRTISDSTSDMSDSPIIGASTQDIITFSAVGTGTTSIAMLYVRPWENNSGIDSFKVSVVVK
jgi:predicted secreted protein